MTRRSFAALPLVCAFGVAACQSGSEPERAAGMNASSEDTSQAHAVDIERFRDALEGSPSNSHAAEATTTPVDTVTDVTAEAGTERRSMPCTGPVPKEGAARQGDGGVVAYIDVDESRHDETALGSVVHEDLCVTIGDRSPRVLLRGRGKSSGRDPSTLADLNHLAVSQDGRTICFDSTEWVTQSAVHCVDTITGREHFVFRGELWEWPFNGPYGGNLVIAYTALSPDDGRKPSFSLVSLSGKIIRKLPTDDSKRDKIIRGH